MISCYCGATPAVSAIIGSAWKKLRVKWCVGWEAEFIFEATGEDLLVLCLTGFEVTFADEVRLHGVEHCMIRMIFELRLVGRVSTDVLQDRVGVVVKMEDMIMQSHLQRYAHVILQGIISQIREVMELQATGKWKKGQPRKL